MVGHHGGSSPAASVGHLVGGDGEEGDVHLEVELGEMKHGIGDVLVKGD